MQRKIRVVLTGAEGDREAIMAPMKERHAQIYFLATTRVVKKKLSSNSIAKLKRISQYDYLFFSSMRSVTFFAQALETHHIALPSPMPKVLAVGPTTAAACRALGFPAVRTPRRFTLKDMGEMLRSVKGKKILFPRSASAPRGALQDLRGRGAEIDTVPLYTSEAVPIAQSRLRNIFRSPVECVAFRSGSAARSFSKNLKRGMLRRKILMTPALCLGPTAATEAKRSGFKRIIIAKIFTAQGMIRALRTLS